MGFRVYSAVVVAVTSAGAMGSAAAEPHARDDELLERAGCDPAWRAPCKTWGHARFLTGIQPGAA
jgi:hypothetical protein